MNRASKNNYALWAVIGISLLAMMAAIVGNLGTAVAARDNCRTNEALKARVRANAIRSLEELPQNLSFIGVQVNQKLATNAIQNRNRTLHEFRPRHCSVMLWKQHDVEDYKIPPLPDWAESFEQ